MFRIIFQSFAKQKKAITVYITCPIYDDNERDSTLRSSELIVKLKFNV